MSVLPTSESNPGGLHQRYTVTKNNGEPVDSSAIYLVLRIDGGGRDAAHIIASRHAARGYIARIRWVGNAEHMQQMADELETLLDSYEAEGDR